ncbi:MAG: SDR family oxidoreductase [Treponema sp.]|jgi:NAD(P)-dependent dehydrogenase (short-subunit alcohol dehydrogenase family)|nr:SDR family oxidoreductase [Treponema sp.]
MYNPFSLTGKTILVTGASSGIGRAIAIECSKMDATVVLTGRNKERLNETISQMEREAHTIIVADLNNEDERKKIVDNLPMLDGLVNCAGISGHSLFSFLKKNEIEQMFSINYFSPLYLTQSILKNKKLKKNSSIVFITSTSGILSSYIGGSLYSSTKGALNGMIKGMCIELAPKSIRVNSVMPSMIDTPIMEGGTLSKEDFEKDKEKYPLKRYGKPEEVAYAVIYLLSDASSWVTGSNLLLDGGRSVSY